MFAILMLFICYFFVTGIYTAVYIISNQCGHRLVNIHNYSEHNNWRQGWDVKDTTDTTNTTDTKDTEDSKRLQQNTSQILAVLIAGSQR